ncbi:MAG: ATP-grasp domain-containing protein [Deltaproteobacteria bacterium]|nr:MAG: ATP-grasp domain-containing protein [Deltaproteobacteria bacterium]TMQ19547.1 MAG: ATP-grasp domain-containing protein [Deltaproteobacteria bacterium]
MQADARGDLFLVLEPGNHMYLVIEAAHRQGFTVAVCHSQPVSPPAPFDQALPCISHFIPVEGWRDSDCALDTIVRWCGDRPVRGTYAGYEITLLTEARLRQRYGLPGIDPARLDLLLDKARVRAALREASLTRLRVVEDDELRRLTEWPFPGRSAFLKPINGSGSIYVRRCQSLTDVREHLAEWDARSRHIKRFVADHLQGGRGLFLEEEAVGELLSVEGYCYRGRYVPLGITDRTVLARDVSVEMGTTFPCPHPRRDEVVEKARRVHECLGFEHGPTHTELIVPPAGDIELVELNARFAGGEILQLIDSAFDVRFEDGLVALSTGDCPAPVPREPVRYASGQDFLAPAHLERFDSIDIPGDDVFFKKVLVKPGTTLKSTNFQTDQVASFAVAADSYAGVLARANELRSQVAINGVRLGDDPNNVVVNYADRWISAS